MRYVRLAVFSCVAVVLASVSVQAQTISSVLPTNSSTPLDAFEPNGSVIPALAKFDTLSSVSVTSSSAASFTTRYISTNSVDSEALQPAWWQTLDSSYQITFSVTAPGLYELTVDTSLVGDLCLDDDNIFPPAGNWAEIFDLSGNHTGGSLDSGSLDLTFAGGSQRLNDTGSSFDPITSPFSLSGSATISGASHGVPQQHTLTFSWTQTSYTPGSGDPSTIRLGQESRLPDVSACTYTVPPRPQAPDGHWVTVTVASASGCGDGVIDVGEDCDEGADNGQAGSCCTASCQLELAGVVCRSTSAGDVCDVPETCDGVSGECPADAVVAAGTVCRTGVDLCDADETCDGIGKDCPADELSPAGTVCRSAAGVCDVAETCSGASAACPSDAKSTGVCRTAAGSCDVAEVCDGVGNDCPADGVEAAGVVCRAAAGICDVEETCDGATAGCPADAFEPATVVCRAASSGDVCDADELCTGSSAGCPADAVEPAGTVCRAAAGGCDVAEECDGVGVSCPADSLATAGTVCRAIAGVCDVAETCDGATETCPADVFDSGTVCRVSAGECDVEETCGGGSASCPADTFVADGTPCSDDGAFCTGDETCLSGSCVSSGDPCTGTFCDEGSDMCLTPDCPTQPAAGCLTSEKSILLYKDKSPDKRDKLIYKWIRGQATTQAALASPLTTAGYDLCLYAGSTAALIMESHVDPGANWSPISNKGYRYKDKTLAQDGTQRIILKASDSDRSKALWKGKGANLPDALAVALPIAEFPVVVQLINDQGSVCMESTFEAADAKKNESDQLKLRDQ